MKNVSIEHVAPNCIRVWFQGSGWIAFSYRTPIAFALNGTVTIRENDWGAITGQHLNAINPDKSVRVSGQEFEQALGKVQLRFTRLDNAHDSHMA